MATTKTTTTKPTPAKNSASKESPGKSGLKKIAKEDLGCCQVKPSTTGSSTTGSSTTESAPINLKHLSCEPTAAPVKNKKSSQNDLTRIVVVFDCGFSNSLFVRGEGIASLSWEKGQPMKNVKNNEWVWETDRPFTKAQFKVLINDKTYEIGGNHLLKNGETVLCKPQF